MYDSSSEGVITLVGRKRLAGMEQQFELQFGRGTLDQVLVEEVEEWNPAYIVGPVVEPDNDKENTTTLSVHESYSWMMIQSTRWI